MSKQKRTVKPQARDNKGRYTSESTHADVPADFIQEARALKQVMDAILDEIDSVLEENAQEFTAQYILNGRPVNRWYPCT